MAGQPLSVPAVRDDGSVSLHPELQRVAVMWTPIRGPRLREWQAALDRDGRLTGTDIRAGVDRLIGTYQGQYPPNPADLITLALQARADRLAAERDARRGAQRGDDTERPAPQATAGWLKDTIARIQAGVSMDTRPKGAH